MRLILTLFFVLYCFTAFGQLDEKFEKGSYIDKENKKIEGFIMFTDLSKYSSGICFKISENEENCSKFGVSEIKEFSTESGKKFEILTFKINNNTDEITVFANLMIKGKASLSKTVYLGNEIYIVNNNNVNYILQNDEVMAFDANKRKYYFRGNLSMATDGYSNSFVNIDFEDKDFNKIIKGYNTLNGSESQILSYKEKNVNYIIGVIGGGFNNISTEYFIQTTYRTYFPKISQNVSLNIGLSYYNNTASSKKNSFIPNNNYALTTIPLQFQYNFFTKEFRPYLFGGLNLSHVKYKNNNEYFNINKGLQKTFGLGILYGGGIEIDTQKGLILKLEYRNEIFPHSIMLGIGYNFSKIK
jgi:opacity protein-like surface antigen